MKYPENLEIPENIVQQIQISHNFVESHITIEEKNWNSNLFSTRFSLGEMPPIRASVPCMFLFKIIDEDYVLIGAVSKRSK